jgi:type III restriction enzyme
MAADEIERFRREIVERTGDQRQADNITDTDLLREAMNTVGKQGRLGESIRCVVSVSMLTEGWDANTVTHVLGVRAFGTQLLCEQVVGRALRQSRPGKDRSTSVRGSASRSTSPQPVATAAPRRRCTSGRPDHVPLKSASRASGPGQTAGERLGPFNAARPELTPDRSAHDHQERRHHRRRCHRPGTHLGTCGVTLLFHVTPLYTKWRDPGE